MLGRDVTTVPSGPKRLNIGGRELHVPTDAQVAPGPSGLTYVLSRGRVYCFSPRGGEITVPHTLNDALRRGYFSPRTP
jgi:hypothetical protein